MDGLSKLQGQLVKISASDQTLDNGAALLQFEGGASLRADYWRLIKSDMRLASSFDHNQRYGLPTPINAIDVLISELQNRNVISARLDPRTGDILIQFSDAIEMQVLNFTAYEVWELTLPDGSVAYSNQAP